MSEAEIRSYKISLAEGPISKCYTLPSQPEDRGDKDS